MQSTYVSTDASITAALATKTPNVADPLALVPGKILDIGMPPIKAKVLSVETDLTTVTVRLVPAQS